MTELGAISNLRTLRDKDKEKEQPEVGDPKSGVLEAKQRLVFKKEEASVVSHCC